MKNRGSTFAFVVGLSAGIFNLIIGFNALSGMLILQAFTASADFMLIAIALFAITAVNFAGGCVCRRNRIAGGVMLLVTAFPLLIVGVILVCIPILPPELLSEAMGADYAETTVRALLGVGILLLIVELASGAAGVVSLVAREREDPEVYAQTEAGVSEAAVESFAQRYAARLGQTGRGPEA